MEKKKNKKGMLFNPNSGNAVNDIIGESQYSKYNTGKDGSTGHGFPGEDANNLIDKLCGKDVVKEGLNNAKNGADRIVDGIKIQTKYCKNPSRTVNSAFDSATGMYRYRYGNGRPMKLEVPRDQYQKCVELIRKKIIEGKIPGVKNPDHAAKMVKRGILTYDQAVKVSQSGTIEGLVYDAVSGTVQSVQIGGISALITFAILKKKGVKTKDAICTAGKEGLWSGGSVGASAVIKAQCTRALQEQTTKKVAETVGSKLASKLTTGALKVGSKGNIIAAIATTAVTSRHDIKKAYRGEISKAQCAENIGVNGVSVASGLAGASAVTASVATYAKAGGTIGTLLGGPMGTVVGIAGGIAVGTVTSVVGAKTARAVIKKVKFWK